MELYKSTYFLDIRRIPIRIICHRSILLLLKIKMPDLEYICCMVTYNLNRKHSIMVHVHLHRKTNKWDFVWGYIKQEKGVSKKCTSITRLSHICRGQIVKCISQCNSQFTRCIKNYARRLHFQFGISNFLHVLNCYFSYIDQNCEYKIIYNKIYTVSRQV